MKDILPKKEKERVVKKVSKSDFLNRPRKKTTKTTKTSPKSIAKKAKQSYSSESLHTSETDNSRFGIWVIAFFSVIVLFFALSFLFKGAKVTVTPKIVEFTLEETLVAFRDGEEGLRE